MTGERIDNLTSEEVQQETGLSLPTIYRMAKDGQYLGVPVRSKRLRSKLFFARADIERVKEVLARRNLFEE